MKLGGKKWGEERFLRRGGAGPNNIVPGRG